MASAETEKCRLELMEGGVSSILYDAATGRPKESSATLAGGGENSGISNIMFQLLYKKKAPVGIGIGSVGGGITGLPSSSRTKGAARLPGEEGGGEARRRR